MKEHAVESVRQKMKKVMDQDYQDNRNKVRYRSAGELKPDRFANTFYRAIDNTVAQSKNLKSGSQGSQGKNPAARDKQTPKGKKVQKKKPYSKNTDNQYKKSDSGHTQARQTESELFSKFVQMVKNQKD